jgi:hypothetical protein
MEPNEEFSLDLGASADLGRDVFEGPSENRQDVSVSAYRLAGDEVTVLIDCGAAADGIEVPLHVAVQLADALNAILVKLQG